HNTLPSTVIGHDVLRTIRRSDDGVPLDPCRTVPLPGVAENPGNPSTPEENHTASIAVVGNRVGVASRWARDRRPLGPGRAVPLPGVVATGGGTARPGPRGRRS